MSLLSADIPKPPLQVEINVLDFASGRNQFPVTTGSDHLQYWHPLNLKRAQAERSDRHGWTSHHLMRTTSLFFSEGMKFPCKYARATCVALTFRYYLWVILFLALFCPFNLSSIEVKDVQLGHQHFKTSRGSMTLPRNFHIFAIWVSRTIAWRYTSENGRRPVNLWLH